MIKKLDAYDLFVTSLNRLVPAVVFAVQNLQEDYFDAIDPNDKDADCMSRYLFERASAYSEQAKLAIFGIQRELQELKETLNSLT